MTTIRIPTPLRPYAGGNGKIAVSGGTVGAALNDLTAQYPELRNHLYEGDSLRSFVNVYLGENDVRYLQGEETAVSDTDTLMIIPSIAGGLHGA
ncbi:MAG: MoaD/ThiS family protein [Chloroflexota bacterium]|jgi:sulfur-carrier protein